VDAKTPAERDRHLGGSWPSETVALVGHKNDMGRMCMRGTKYSVAQRLSYITSVMLMKCM
jgi:hypothetical protein